jgi:predicted HAD superfamily Cof-like phosphohydrolase
MKCSIERVRQMMHAYDQKVRHAPGFGGELSQTDAIRLMEIVDFMKEVSSTLGSEKESDSDRILRLKLDIEEFAELLMAEANDDIVNWAKEASDLCVTLFGNALHKGIDLSKAFNGVMDSNMTKLGDDGKPVKNEDGKVVKGPNYQPVDMEALVATMAGPVETKCGTCDCSIGAADQQRMVEE